jgi:hypothetical protein
MMVDSRQSPGVIFSDATGWSLSQRAAIDFAKFSAPAKTAFGRFQSFEKLVEKSNAQKDLLQVIDQVVES